MHVTILLTSTRNFVYHYGSYRKNNKIKKFEVKKKFQVIIIIKKFSVGEDLSPITTTVVVLLLLSATTLKVNINIQHNHITSFV